MPRRARGKTTRSIPAPTGAASRANGTPATENLGALEGERRRAGGRDLAGLSSRIGHDHKCRTSAKATLPLTLSLPIEPPGVTVPPLAAKSPPTVPFPVRKPPELTSTGETR
jgi:hypothetical protein